MPKFHFMNKDFFLINSTRTLLHQKTIYKKSWLLKFEAKNLTEKWQRSLSSFSGELEVKLLRPQSIKKELLV